jgi:hypothetical protein
MREVDGSVLLTSREEDNPLAILYPILRDMYVKLLKLSHGSLLHPDKLTDGMDQHGVPLLCSSCDR